MSISIGFVCREKFCQFCQESVLSPNGIFASSNYTQCIAVLVLSYGIEVVVLRRFRHKTIQPDTFRIYHYDKSVISRLSRYFFDCNYFDYYIVGDSCYHIPFPPRKWGE